MTAYELYVTGNIYSDKIGTFLTKGAAIACGIAYPAKSGEWVELATVNEDGEVIDVDIIK